MDMDYVYLHDEVHSHPKDSQAEPLARRSLRDVPIFLKTSRQQHKARSQMARDRISFKIQPRKGMYQPPWISGATTELSEYRWGEPAGNLVL